MDFSQMSRRTVLRWGLGGLTIGTAGCSSDGNSRESDQLTSGTATSDEAIDPSTVNDTRGANPNLAGQYSTYSANAARTGSVSTQGPSAPVTAQPLSDELSYLWGEPVVADGTVFVTTETKLLAIDTETSESRVLLTDNYFSHKGSLTLAHGRIYAITVGGELYAVDLESEAPNWRFQSEDEFEYLSLTVVEDAIYLVDATATLSALDAETQRLRWTYDLAPKTNYPDIPESPAVANGTVYAAVDEGTHGFGTTTKQTAEPPYGGLVALDARTGEERWRFDSRWLAAGPVVGEQHVYVGARMDRDTPDPPGFVAALDPETGAEQWRRNFPEGSVMYSPAVANGTLYVPVAIFEDGDWTATNVHAFDETGERQWKYEAPITYETESDKHDAPRIPHMPTVSDDAVYVGFGPDGVKALDAETGDLRWHVKVGQATGDSVAVAEDAAYVIGFSTDGRSPEAGRVYSITSE